MSEEWQDFDPFIGPQPLHAPAPAPDVTVGIFQASTGKLLFRVSDRRDRIELYADGIEKIAIEGDFPNNTRLENGVPVQFEVAVPRPTPLDVKREAARRLAETDWMILRELDGGKAMGKEVRASRQAIRAASDRLEAMPAIPYDYTADKYWTPT